MKLLRKPEVEAKVGMCERVFRDMERRGIFPKRVLINPVNGRAVAWVEAEIDQFLAQRVAARDAA